MNFASFKNALGQVVQSASSSARDFGATVCGPRSGNASLSSHSGPVLNHCLVQVTGTPKALREYTLQGQAATGGLNGCWKIFAAKAKKEGKPSYPSSATLCLSFIFSGSLGEPLEM